MIRANLESLGLPHHQSNFPSLLVLQQPHVAGSPLLPLVPVLIEPIQLRLPNNKISKKTQKK